MEPTLLVLLLTLAFAATVITMSVRESRHSSAEDKVLKGYFLLGLSGLMAKLAMADGRVTGEEAALASRIFEAMDLSDAERAMCIGNFVTARQDGLSARDHARRFMAYASRASCAFLYDLLWRLSMADGRLDAAEDRLLADIALFLGLDKSDYETCKGGKRLIHSRHQLVDAGVPRSLLALAN